jgi:hypothetical protein
VLPQTLTSVLAERSAPPGISSSGVLAPGSLLIYKGGNALHRLTTVGEPHVSSLVEGSAQVPDLTTTLADLRAMADKLGVSPDKGDRRKKETWTEAIQEFKLKAQQPSHANQGSAQEGHEKKSDAAASNSPQAPQARIDAVLTFSLENAQAQVKRHKQEQHKIYLRTMFGRDR